MLEPVSFYGDSHPEIGTDIQHFFASSPHLLTKNVVVELESILFPSAHAFAPVDILRRQERPAAIADEARPAAVTTPPPRPRRGERWRLPRLCRPAGRGTDRLRPSFHATVCSAAHGSALSCTFTALGAQQLPRRRLARRGPPSQGACTSNLPAAVAARA